METASEMVGRKYTVFISHAGTDTWVARRIAEKIDERGGAAFLDEEDIAIGEDFEERMLAALECSDELLVLLTPWALKRPYVWTEVGAAAIRRIPIVGVLHGQDLRDLQRRSGVPLQILRRNLIDLNGLDRYLQELGQRIAAIRGV